MLYQQPQGGPLQLDPGFRLAAPIVVSSLVSRDGYNSVTGKLGTISGTVTSMTGTPGMGLAFTGNTTGRLDYPASAAAQTKFTAAAVFVWRSGGANNFPQLCGSSTGNTGFRVAANGSSGGDISLVKGGVAALTALSVSPGVPYALVTSHDEATGDYYLLLRNLVTGAVTAATQNSTAASSAGNGTAAIGCARTDFNGAWNGDIFMAAMAFDYLPRAQGEAWLQNLWQIFEDPDEGDDFVAISALAAVVAEVATGSDSCGATLVSAAAVAEAVTSMEAQIAAASMIASASESAAAFDAASAVAAAVAAAAESVSGADVVGASAAMTGACADSAPATETSGASISSAATAVAEAAPAVDLVGAQQQATISISEGAAGADASGADAGMTVAQVESGVAADSSNSAGATISAALVEVAGAVDGCSAAAMLLAACSEVAAANDTVANLMMVAVSLLESAGMVDITAAILAGDVVFARAPTGSGFSPHRAESQSRPAAGPQYRPAAIQRSDR